MVEVMNIAVGVAYIITGTVGLIANITCAILIAKNKELRNASYFYMINLCIADAILLLPIAIYLGIVVILNNNSCDYCERVFNLFLQISWYPGGCFFVLVSLTRFIMLKYSHLNKKIFTKRFMVVSISLPWLCFGALSSMNLFYSKTIGMTFPFLYTWGLNTDHTYGEFMAWYNLSHDMLCSFINCCFNVGSILWIRNSRKQIQSMDTTNSRKREIKLFIQCFITSMFYVTVCVMYAIVFKVAQIMAPYHFMICHSLWILNHCVSPFIYFAFNPKLRETLKGLVSSQTQTTTVATMSSSVRTT